MKNKYGNNSRLALTDTDSLMYEIKTEDVYGDFINDKKMFTLNNYNSSKVVVGKMKDETAGVAIEEFVD